MNGLGRRIAIGASLTLLGLVLTGCHAAGTIDIQSDDQVAVDLTVSGTDVDCAGSVYGLHLNTAAVVDSSGVAACHVFGASQASGLNQFGVDITSAAEYLVLQTNLSLGISELPSSDLQVRFPGQVVSSSQGTVKENVVHLTDLRPLVKGSGLRVIALSSPGPPLWMITAASGVVAGAVATLLVVALVWLLRRRSPRQPTPIAMDSAAEPGPDAGASLGDLGHLHPDVVSRAAPWSTDGDSQRRADAAPERGADPQHEPASPRVNASTAAAVADRRWDEVGPVEPGDAAIWAPPEDSD